jgi:hypothetical protein
MSIKHKKEMASHSEFLLTTKHYSSEEKLLKIAHKCGHVSHFNGAIYIDNPYKRVKKPMSFGLSQEF